MSRLKDLSKDKETIMLRLLSSQGICKALKYSNSNFLDQPDIDDPSELMYNKILPYYRISKTTTELSTFVLLSFRDYRLVGNAFKSGYINFYVATHVDLAKTDYGFLRYDYILSEIDVLMNDKHGIGVGKPQFYKMDEASYMNPDYVGFYISYKLYEWN